MWYPARTIDAPDGDVVTLEDAKTFLRVDGDDEDGLIEDAVAGATGAIEAYTDTRLLSQVVEVRCGAFADLGHLPIGPVSGVAEILYLDASGVEQVLDPARYELFGAGLERGIRPSFGGIWPTIRPVSDAIAVRLQVGYGASADVPDPVVRAVLLLAGDFYAHRAETIVERSVAPQALPTGVAFNLSNFRLFA